MVCPNAPVTYAHFSSVFKEFKDNVIQIFFQNSDEQKEEKNGKTLPPTDNSITSGANRSVLEGLILEQALEKIAFPVLIPPHIPESYRFNRIRGFKEPNDQPEMSTWNTLITMGTYNEGRQWKYARS